MDFLLDQDIPSRIDSPDANNNCAQKTYSLRPRSLQKRFEESEPVERTVKKYTCRPKGRHQGNHQPLSKYRRKTANARERSRMREINEAFETLRKAIPPVAASSAKDVQNEKLTKISTLRLAMNYISALHRLLQTPENVNEFNKDINNPNLHPKSPPPYPSSLSDTSFQECAFINDFQDISLTPSEVTDQSVSSSSDVSDLFMISVDFDAFPSDPASVLSLPSATEKHLPLLDQNITTFSFQDQCSVLDEVMFLRSS